MSVAEHVISILTGSILIIGTTLCYIPQVVELLCRNSTVGVSYWTYVLSTFAYWLNFLSLFIDDYWQLISNLDVKGGMWGRFDAWFAVINLWVQFAMPLAIVVTFLVVLLRETNPDWVERQNKKMKILKKKKEKEEKEKEKLAVAAADEDENSGQHTPNAESSNVIDETTVLLTGDDRNSIEGGETIDEEESIQAKRVFSEQEKDSSSSSAVIREITKMGTVQRYVMSWILVFLISFIALSWVAAVVMAQFRWRYRSKVVDILPIIAAVLFFGLWLPQIFLTACIVRGKGSMSLITLGLCFLGSIVSGVYLGVSGTKWVNWLPYLFLAFQQGFVFVLIVFFESVKCIVNRCKRKKRTSNHLGDDFERGG